MIGYTYDTEKIHTELKEQLAGYGEAMMITAIAKRKADGDRFLVEELRSEMHIAIPVVVKVERRQWIRSILGEIADAYIRGYKGRAIP